MGYEDSLRQARELLISEINELKEQLARKEQHLRKLDSFLKEPYAGSRNGTINQNGGRNCTASQCGDRRYS